jgi:hypothetical protein
MITIEFQPTLEDYRAFYYRVMKKRLGFLSIIAFVVLVFALLSPFFASTVTKPSIAPLDFYRENSSSIVIPAVILLLAYTLWNAPRKMWKKTALLREKVRYTLDESTVKRESEGLSSTIVWRQITGYSTDGRLFILNITGGSCHYFPESAVPDREALIGFLDSHIPAAD